MFSLASVLNRISGVKKIHSIMSQISNNTLAYPGAYQINDMILEQPQG